MNISSQSNGKRIFVIFHNCRWINLLSCTEKWLATLYLLTNQATLRKNAAENKQARIQIE